MNQTIAEDYAQSALAIVDNLENMEATCRMWLDDIDMLIGVATELQLNAQSFRQEVTECRSKFNGIFEQLRVGYRARLRLEGAPLEELNPLFDEIMAVKDTVSDLGIRLSTVIAASALEASYSAERPGQNLH